MDFVTQNFHKKWIALQGSATDAARSVKTIIHQKQTHNSSIKYFVVKESEHVFAFHAASLSITNTFNTSP